MSKSETKTGLPTKRALSSKSDAQPSSIANSKSSGKDRRFGKQRSSKRQQSDEEQGFPATDQSSLPLPPHLQGKLSPAVKARNVRRSRVALYFADNFLHFVEFLQLMGLLWSIMFQVPWPSEWAVYTSWTLFANLDGSMYWFYHNFTTALDNRQNGTADPHFNLWGEIRGYGLLYASAWATAGLLLMVLVLCIHGTKQSYHHRACWQAPALQRLLQWGFYVLYLPFGIALLRPFACSYSDFRGAIVMDHDTSQQCWQYHVSLTSFTSMGGLHGPVAIVCGVVAAMVLLYMPVWTIAHLYRHIVFEGRERHEHFLLQKQTEFVLGVNNDYVVHNMGFFASFRQPATFFRVLVFLRKLAMVLIYVFLRHDAVLQLELLWGVQVVWCILLTILTPFRVRNTNVVMLLLDYSFAILGLLCVLRAAETNSDAFVDSVFQFILIGVVGAGLVIAFFVWAVDGGCLSCNPHQYRVSEPDDKSLHWVAEILRVQDTLNHLNARPLELIDLDELRSELKEMSKCFEEAREERHILRYTLQDCMEDVQATVDECENLAMFPNTKLSLVVPALRTELDHQSEVHALVAPRSRRWIRKLEALRLFRIGYRGPQSDSDDDFADWEDSEAQTTSPQELLAQTQDALLPPVDQQMAVVLKKHWRARIQRWKQDFYSRTGSKPKTDDMWEIDEWRTAYLRLKDATQT